MRVARLVVAAVLVTAFAAVSARPVFKHARPVPLPGGNGRVFAHHATIADDDGTTTQLDYEVERAENVVLLNDEAAVTDVFCNGTEIRVSLSDPSVASTWGTGTILNGGLEWGCRFPEDKMPMASAFIRRILSAALHDREFVADTAPASLADCFTAANISIVQTAAAATAPVPSPSRIHTSAAPSPVPPSHPSTPRLHDYDTRITVSEPAIEFDEAVRTYRAGDRVEVRYKTPPALSGYPVYFKLCEGSGWISSCSQTTEWRGYQNTGYFAFTVQERWLNNGDVYHVEVCHHIAGWTDPCNRAPADLSFPKVRFIQPTATTVARKGTYLWVEWETHDGVPLTGSVEIRLYRDIPYWRDPILATTTVSGSSGYGFISIPSGLEASILPVYVELRWNCRSYVLYTSCNTVESANFALPETKTGGRHVTETLVNRDCNTLRQTGACPSETDPWCKLCGVGRNMTVTVTCDNCGVTYDYEVTRFELLKNSAGIINYVRFEANGGVELNVDLLAKLSFAMSYERTVEIVRNLPIKAISFSVAGVAVSVGVSMDLDLLFELSASGHGSFELVGDGNYRFNAKYEYDGEHNYVITPVGSPTGTQLQPTFNFDAALGAKVSLVPALNIGVSSVLDARVQAAIYADFNARFSYPAHSAVLSGSWSPAPFVYPPTSCESPHLLRYKVDAGVEDIFGQLDVGLSLVGFNALQWQFQTPKLAVEPWPVLSGCWLNVEAGAIATVSLSIKGHRAIDAGTFSYNIAVDIASALSIEPRRIKVSVTGYDTSLDETSLRIDIVPAGESPSIADQPSSKQASALLEELRKDESSAFYQGVETRYAVVPPKPVDPDPVDPTDPTDPTDPDPVNPNPPKPANGGEESSESFLEKNIGAIAGGATVVVLLLVAAGVCVWRLRRSKPKETEGVQERTASTAKKAPVTGATRDPASSKPAPVDTATAGNPRNMRQSQSVSPQAATAPAATTVPEEGKAASAPTAEVEMVVITETDEGMIG